MENRLYVGNLPFSATDEELKQAFSPHGTVTEVASISDLPYFNSEFRNPKSPNLHLNPNPLIPYLLSPNSYLLS